MDFSTGAFDEALVQEAGIDASCSAPIASAHAILGPINAEAAHATGLPWERQVCSPAAADHVASAYRRVGASASGDSGLNAAGRADIRLSTAKAVTDPSSFIDYQSASSHFQQWLHRANWENLEILG